MWSYYFSVEQPHSVDDARFLVPVQSSFCSRKNAGGADKIDDLRFFFDAAALENATLCAGN